MSAQIEDLDKHPIAGKPSVGEQVPIIDIAALVQNSSGDEAKTCIHQIADACQTWGFFQVVNHGISDQMIANVWQQTRAIFALPLEQKITVLRTRKNPWGFYNNELTKNQRDKKEVFDFTREGVDPIYQQRNCWPQGQDTFKTTMMDYFEACTQLSLTLLEGFCVGLNLSPGHMHSNFETNHTGFLRLNYYPVKDPMSEIDADYQTDADLGVHHHTDAGALTVLMQDDVGGLQVYRKGYWHDIPFVPGAMVINTGDMMQVWSNDRYQAAIHRVLAMDSVDRYSLPFFFNPAAGARVTPLATVINDENPAKYREIEWAKFRGQRTDGDYADYGTEVQISQFRV